MAPRFAAHRERDVVDYSAIGKLGRRTGVTLDQRPLDANGIEEISGMFSSPRKPSPLKNMTVLESVEEAGATPSAAGLSSPKRLDLTPAQAVSSRRSARGASIPRPRSSSPRKSGISGTARRANGVDIFSAHKTPQPEDPADRENTPIFTPTRTSQPRRFSPSPDKSPLRDITTNGQSVLRKSGASMMISPSPDELPASFDDERPDSDEEAVQEMETVFPDIEESEPAHIEDEPAAGPQGRQESEELGFSARSLEDGGAESSSDEDIPPVAQQANSSKKRKLDMVDPVEQDVPVVPTKVQKTRGPTPDVENGALTETEISTGQDSEVNGNKPSQQRQSKPAPSRREQALNDIIEKVTARPARSRPLYILRRETPADDEVTHTRSGRVSVKPLAYWRNERCVYGGSPGSASLEDGARFPLNSIKEIVRTEQIEPKEKKNSKGRKKKGKGGNSGKGKAKPDRVAAEDSETSDSDADLDNDGASDDPYAEPWETQTGTLLGNVAIWDNEEQTPTEEEEQVEIAHAAAAIKTKEVKASNLHDGPTFRYAKLLGTKFFGTGLVDLPPGGMKRPKNSRKMHMSFFVVKGRVTVTVGPVGSEESGRINRFSIGKGGFWQVPRGNQYSIENELQKPARVFFSQGCEPDPGEEED